MTTILGVPHVPDVVRASLLSFSAELVVIPEFLEECTLSEQVIRVVRHCKRGNSRLCTQDHKVSETDLMAPLIVDVDDVDLL